jgi:phosphatidylglycerol:prolipoprotein diacylglycerol transferase
MDPMIHQLGGLRIWWYGLAYALGFLVVHLWVLFRRKRLGYSLEELFDFSLLITLGALIGGRAFDVLIYEWDYYRGHAWQLPAFWHGGFATHGIVLGGVLGGTLFCRLRHKSFLALADEVVIPGALMLALGRVGNHINGEVYGSLSEVGWAMRFPYATGTRHPVALYEGAKNVLVAVILLGLRRCSRHTPGLLLAHFLLWYGLLRLIADHFRDYDSYWLGIGRGQYFNLLMALVGAVAIVVFSRRPSLAITPRGAWDQHAPRNSASLWLKAAAFYGLVVVCLAIPSGWTQQVLETMRV